MANFADTNQVLLNDGSGGFTVDPCTTDELSMSVGVAVGDFDNDGFDDIAVAVRVC